jgi:hypothetical protein
MKEAFTTCIVFAIIIAGFALVFYITAKTTDFICERALAKRRKQHPELFQLIDKCNEAGINQCKWHNKNITPKKNSIDKILREIDYLPKEQREEAEIKLEELRKGIWLAEVTYKELKAEHQKIRDEIHAYIDKHDLQWARNWGW